MRSSRLPRRKEEQMKSIFCHKAKAAPPAANTLRFEFSNQSYSPVTAGVGSSGTWKRCEFMPGNVWDWTKVGFASGLKNAFADSDNLVSLIAANTSGVLNLYSTFQGCTSLTSVCLFDTSSVSVFSYTFQGCTSLNNIPLFNTSSVTQMNSTFQGCAKVKGGALALYQQVSTQATLPSFHTDCFKDCGKDTETGAAELAQIPTSWGGTKEEA